MFKVNKKKHQNDDIVNFDNLQLFFVFLLIILNKKMLAGSNTLRTNWKENKFPEVITSDNYSPQAIIGARIRNIFRLRF